MKKAKKQKKTALVLALVLLLGILTGCATGNSNNTGGENGGDASFGNGDGTETVYEIAYVYDVMNLSTEVNLQYLKDYFTYYESTHQGIKIEISEFNCDNDVEQQINDVQTCIAMGVDCIIFKYYDAEALVDFVSLLIPTISV